MIPIAVGHLPQSWERNHIDKTSFVCTLSNVRSATQSSSGPALTLTTSTVVLFAQAWRSCAISITIAFAMTVEES